jgi:cytochrome c oxidase assembly factor CtaG
LKKSDVLLIILGIALVVGMLLTALFGRGSRHGYGMVPVEEKPFYLSGLAILPVTKT